MAPKRKDTGYSRRYRKIRRLKTVGTHVALILCIVVIALPVLYAILGSTQTTGEAYRYPPKLTPGSALLDNFHKAWDLGLGKMLLNTFLVAAGVVVGKTILSILAGFAFVYFQFPAKDILFFLVLVTLMFPLEVRIVSLFNFMQKLQLGNTYYALVLPFMASATGTYLFRQHFKSIPKELLDAARVDGAGPMRFLFQILLPISWNTIGALAAVMFVYAWNQYLWPLLIITTKEKQMIQVGLKMALQAEAGEIDWGMAMAATLLSIIPPLVVFFLLQERFMRGFALGHEK